jgi:hypothetical protein
MGHGPIVLKVRKRFYYYIYTQKDFKIFFLMTFVLMTFVLMTFVPMTFVLMIFVLMTFLLMALSDFNLLA